VRSASLRPAVAPAYAPACRWNIEKVGSDFKSSTRISDVTGTFGPSDTILKPKTSVQAAEAAKLDAVRLREF
jgi:hypothetical protein